MENDRIAKKIYVGKCACSHSVGRLRKRWKRKDCLKKIGLDVRQARRMVNDRSEWLGLVGENAWGVAQGMNP